jgi:hypothetical protein
VLFGTMNVLLRFNFGMLYKERDSHSQYKGNEGDLLKFTFGV